MSNSFNPYRDGSGRFAPGATSTPAVSLGGTDTAWAADDWDGPLPDSAQVVTCDDPQRLDEFVFHPSWQVRADATANPNLSPEQLDYLANPDMHPEAVRAGVAMSGLPGAARRVTDDPSPTVRAMASSTWDVPDVERDRLRSQAAVLTVCGVLAD